MSPSPLNEIIRADVEEAREALLNKVVEPWAFFNSHGIRIKRADGRPISISGCAYAGSAVVDAFWHAFIDEHLKKTSRLLIESTRMKAVERQVPIQDALSDCLIHLRTMIDKTFYRMAVIDQHLRGKGFPQSVQKKDTRDRIERSYKDIKRLIDAEILCSQQPKIAPKENWFDALELKPNFFGMGLNLNWLILKCSRKKKRS
jgi:hypothetical protein